MKDKKKGKFYSRHVIEKTLKHHLIEWIGTGGSLAGVFMVAQQVRIGFLVWMTANILWMWFAFHHKHWGLLFLSSSYLLINLYGFINWGLV